MITMHSGVVVDQKYRIERKLGEGGMGAVYLAVHVALGHHVAIKVLSAERATDAQRARFLGEARAAAQLNSEHIVRVQDIGQLDDGTPYIVMERLHGIDLEQLLRQRGGKLPLEEALSYFFQTLEGLALAHAHGIVHRDIKPANLFLSERPDGSRTLKILDFGLAKAAQAEFGPLTGSNDVFGSPQYMAPEQLKSSKSVDARADLWSLGITLFELVTGQSPFRRASPAEYIAAVLKSPPLEAKAFGVDMPAPIEAAIRACLEKDPNARVASVRALHELLGPHRRESTSARIDEILRTVPGVASDGARWQSSDAVADTERAVQKKENDGTRTTGAVFSRGPASNRQGRRWPAGVLAVGTATAVIIFSLTRKASEPPAPIGAPPVLAASAIEVRSASVVEAKTAAPESAPISLDSLPAAPPSRIINAPAKPQAQKKGRTAPPSESVVPSKGLAPEASASSRPPDPRDRL